jgi:hypothetical protein
MTSIFNYKTNTKGFKDITRLYDEAKNWLESNGILVNNTRFRRSRDLINKGLSRSPRDNHEILWAYIDLHDLFDIYSHLSEIDSNRFIETLKKITSGHELLSEEKSDGGSGHGRNFTFELFTAARLARAGYKVTFKTDADIDFIINNSKIHVECKRVQSHNSIEKNIDKAMAQIEVRCGNSSSDRGIVAISISKLIWNQFNELINERNEPMFTDTKTMQDAFLEFINELGISIRNKYSQDSKRTIGLILHYKVPYWINSNGIPIPAFINRFTFVYFNNNQLLPEISEKLSRSVGVI